MSQGDFFDLNKGRELRDAGVKKVSGPHADWLDRARRVAMMVAQRRGEVSIIDIWRHCPPPDGAHPNLMGTVFRSKLFKKTGRYIQNPRPSAHARVVAVYELRRK